MRPLLSVVLNPLLFLLLFGYCPSAVSATTGGGEARISVGFKVHLIQAPFIYKVERRVSAVCFLIMAKIKLLTTAFFINTKGPHI